MISIENKPIDWIGAERRRLRVLEMFHPDEVGRREALLMAHAVLPETITTFEDLKSLPKKDRQLIGKHVGKFLASLETEDAFRVRAHQAYWETRTLLHIPLSQDTILTGEEIDEKWRSLLCTK